MSIEINALESRRFGIVAARLLDPHAALEQVNTDASAQNVQMITARVDSSALRRVQQLEADGYRLMDTLVYYARNLSLPFDKPALPSGEVVRLATTDDAPAVARVARAAFTDYLGHYHSDPRLSSVAADAAYVEWAENSIARCSARTPALVAISGHRIIAFLTLDLDSAEIVLNAVHPDENGRGVYGRLIDHAIEIARGAGLAELSVSTQLNNVTVQKAWVRRDFRITRSLYTLHKWF